MSQKSRAKRGYLWEDHRTGGRGLIFLVPDGHDKASAGWIDVKRRDLVEAHVADASYARAYNDTHRTFKTLSAAKKWVLKEAS